MKDIHIKVLGGSEIVVVRKSVVEMDVDAIVNAANTGLLGGGGVDGAIHRAAGPGLLEECRKLGGCKTGSAKITGGYNLKAGFVIHAVGPVYHGEERDAELLASCYMTSMDLAVKNGCRSVAFPCISTGVYGYPLKDACKIVMDTLLRWYADNAENIKVYLCCFSDREYETFRQILGK